eukprot:TRINITY_DN8066_c0_g1_i1.p1 TRINITY_DN8066_c0_g1~~TRINITY_DN8066_c0_g1_i1.p1  ORF type:complete len:162 (-),score=33.48 TRINITY_DN8066_c0_g1_i1:125-610(-)
MKTGVQFGSSLVYRPLPPPPHGRDDGSFDVKERGPMYKLPLRALNDAQPEMMISDPNLQFEDTTCTIEISDWTTAELDAGLEGFINDHDCFLVLYRSARRRTFEEVEKYLQTIQSIKPDLLRQPSTSSSTSPSSSPSSSDFPPPPPLPSTSTPTIVFVLFM